MQNLNKKKHLFIAVITLLIASLLLTSCNNTSAKKTDSGKQAGSAETSSIETSNNASESTANAAAVSNSASTVSPSSINKGSVISGNNGNIIKQNNSSGSGNVQSISSKNPSKSKQITCSNSGGSSAGDSFSRAAAENYARSLGLTVLPHPYDCYTLNYDWCAEKKYGVPGLKKRILQVKNKISNARYFSFVELSEGKLWFRISDAKQDLYTQSEMNQIVSDGIAYGEKIGMKYNPNNSLYNSSFIDDVDTEKIPTKAIVNRDLKESIDCWKAKGYVDFNIVAMREEDFNKVYSKITGADNPGVPYEGVYWVICVVRG